MKFIISILLILSFCNLSAQSVYIPQTPEFNSQQFTISADYNFPAGIKKIEWKVTSGTAKLLNPSDSFVVVQVLTDGSYRFDCFVTDNNNITVSDWVPVTVINSASNPIPVKPPLETIIVRDTIRQYIDTCSIDYTKLIDVQFVLVLPDEGGTVRLPDSTTVYQAIHGAAQPHIRLKDDISLIMYRFQRTYVINGVSTPVRFTMYKTGAWRRELKDVKGIWQNYPYAPY